jgi:hypothetical protein
LESWNYFSRNLSNVGFLAAARSSGAGVEWQASGNGRLSACGDMGREIVSRLSIE